MALFKRTPSFASAQLGIAGRMLALIESFPTLHHCPPEFWDDGFDPVAFGRWGLRGGGGRKDAALFCLSVWNSITDWDEHVPGLAREGNHGRFELHAAFSNWDHEHRAAFIAFCNNPWWP